MKGKCSLSPHHPPCPMTKHNSIVSMGEYGKPQRQRKSNQNSLTNFIENTGMLSSHQASAISYRSSLVLLPLQYMPSLLHLCLYLGVIKIQINVARCECVCMWKKIHAQFQTMIRHRTTFFDSKCNKPFLVKIIHSKLLATFLLYRDF